MSQKELTLNDFEAFDQYIFGTDERDWTKLYKKHSDTFIPPIEIPLTEEEFQLNHYALWMVIAHCDLRSKPHFDASTLYTFRSKCFACEYKKLIDNNSEAKTCSLNCPLTSLTKNSCASAYLEWTYARRFYNESADVFRLATEIAKIPWREIKIKE